VLAGIEIDTELVIAVSEDGDVRVGPAPRDPWRSDETGSTTYEVLCRSLAHVRGPRAAPGGAGLLRLDRDWPNGAAALAHHYAGRVAALTFDADARLRVTARRFSSAAKATKALATRDGEWLVVSFAGGRLHPRLASTDPFTTDVVMPGSYVAEERGALRGPFVGMLPHFVEWILTHSPSGYSTVQVLERVEVVDVRAGPTRAAVGRPDEPPAPCRAFLRGRDARAPARAEFPSAAAARDAILGEPGRWLLARPVDAVSVH
jgi:hypothetical protein